MTTTVTVGPLERFWTNLSGLFTANLFEVGDKEISIAFLFELLLSLIIAYFVARATKQLIKNFMLNRLKMERGTVESLSSIIGYIITGLALFIVLQIFGIGLSSLTIFAGAIGIGFGIGLQDLASNFISGITILVERPIKVGDYIKIDDVEGSVISISIRATVLESNDGVFAIVPNKAFLENNIINWNYKAKKGCLHIPIDLPDDSDPLVVAEALISAARRDPRVLGSPPPNIEFKGFKEGMDFELIVWIENMQLRDEISSDVYFMIEEELRARGVKRSIPRRKLYIDNLSELGVRVQMLPTATSNGHVLAAGEVATDSEADVKRVALGDVLRKISYFSNCSDIELRQIILQGYRKILRAEAVICRENDPGDSFYIILSGEVEVFVESINKRVAVRTGGEFIGEMSLLMGTPRTAMLRTLTETELFVVDRENLKGLLAKFPNLADKISEELSSRQDTLERLGIKITSASEEETPFNQIRNRIRSLFGI